MPTQVSIRWGQHALSRLKIGTRRASYRLALVPKLFRERGKSLVNFRIARDFCDDAKLPILGSAVSAGPTASKTLPYRLVVIHCDRQGGIAWAFVAAWTGFPMLPDVKCTE